MLTMPDRDSVASNAIIITLTDTAMKIARASSAPRTRAVHLLPGWRVATVGVCVRHEIAATERHRQQHPRCERVAIDEWTKGRRTFLERRRVPVHQSRARRRLARALSRTARGRSPSGRG